MEGGRVRELGVMVREELMEEEDNIKVNGNENGKKEKTTPCILCVCPSGSEDR